MTAQEIKKQPIVSIVNNQTTTTSLNIAEVFGKRHDDVLKTIRALDTPQEFRLRNFAESSYTSTQGKEQPMFTLTRDGFTLLVMGFTGAKAIKFKLAYIDAFNRMEAELNKKALPPPADLAFTLERHEKRCSGCRQAKPLSEFNRNLTRSDGFATYCKLCAGDKQREHSARNRERNLVVIQTRKPVAVGEAIASERERRLRREVLNLVPPVAGLMRQCLKVAKTLPAGPLCDELLDSVEKCVSVQEMILHVLNESRVS